MHTKKLFLDPCISVCSFQITFQYLFSSHWPLFLLTSTTGLNFSNYFLSLFNQLWHISNSSSSSNSMPFFTKHQKFLSSSITFCISKEISSNFLYLLYTEVFSSIPEQTNILFRWTGQLHGSMNTAVKPIGEVSVHTYCTVACMQSQFTLLLTCAEVQKS